jgi:hypothetical protein
MPNGELFAVNFANAGLGNRLRFTLSAQALAEAEGRRFRYLWPTDKDFSARLTELWEYEPGESASMSESRQLLSEFPYVNEKVDFWTPEMRALPIWHVRSVNTLPVPEGSQTWEQHFRALTPVQQIRDRISDLRDAVAGRRYVGVMIRAHERSHVKTLEASPVAWYTKRMAELQAAEPNLWFYISSDVQEVQDAVIASIPNCFGQTDKGPYNTTAGVQSSVADLYMLASSVHILAPYWSSFGDISWILSDGCVAKETSRTMHGDPTAWQLVDPAPDPLKPSLRAQVIA